MTPIEKACAHLLERQTKRNTLHLNFGAAMNPPREPGLVNSSGRDK